VQAKLGANPKKELHLNRLQPCLQILVKGGIIEQRILDIYAGKQLP
jgi:hypothetical protein